MTQDGVVNLAMSIVFVLSFPSPVSFGAAPSSPSTLNLAPCGLVGVPKTLGGVAGVVVCVGARCRRLTAIEHGRV